MYILLFRDFSRLPLNKSRRVCQYAFGCLFHRENSCAFLWSRFTWTCISASLILSAFNWLDAVNYNQYICDYEFHTLIALQFNSFYPPNYWILPGPFIIPFVFLLLFLKHYFSIPHPLLFVSFHSFRNFCLVWLPEWRTHFFSSLFPLSYIHSHTKHFATHIQHLVNVLYSRSFRGKQKKKLFDLYHDECFF